MSTQPTPAKPDNGLAYAILGVAATVIIGLVVLTITGHQVDRYVEFATFLIPLLIMQIWTATRVNKVQDQVNGNLTQRLTNVANDIKDHVTNVAAPTADNAEATNTATTPDSVNAGV